MNQRLAIFSQAFDIMQETSSHETLDISSEQKRKEVLLFQQGKKVNLIFTTKQCI